jgi:hypothetical protein
MYPMKAEKKLPTGHTQRNAGERNDPWLELRRLLAELLGIAWLLRGGTTKDAIQTAEGE